MFFELQLSLATQRACCRAYLHHLLDAKELLGWMLLEVHNVHHMQRFMAAVRTAVHAGELAALESSLPQCDCLPPPATTTPSTAMSQSGVFAALSE
jgi:queuine/archaeosine tRNA-ribosyltransferase